MTKAEIVNRISKLTGSGTKEVNETIDSFFGVVKESMEKGNEIFIRGFGSFIIKKRATKVARDLHRMTSVVIPEHNIPMFKPCDQFKELVKNGKKNSD